MIVFDDEDGWVNILKRSLHLWDGFVNSRYLQRKTFLLLLNDRDIFAEKIKKIPLTRCFSDYRGSNTYESTTKYIIKRFQDKYRGKGGTIVSMLVCGQDNLAQIVSRTVEDANMHRVADEIGWI